MTTTSTSFLPFSKLVSIAFANTAQPISRLPTDLAKPGVDEVTSRSPLDTGPIT